MAHGEMEGTAGPQAVQFPQSLEAERAVLGGLLKDSLQVGEISEILRGEDFYRDAHGQLFQLMLDHEQRGEPLDMVGLTDMLLDSGRAEEFGGISYVSSLPEQVPSVENISYYAGIVRDKARRRNLLKTANDIVKKCFDGGDATGELYEFAEQSIFELGQLKGKRDWHPVSLVLDDEIARLERLSDNPGEVTGLPTRFLDLDKKLAGLQPSDLIILAARPSMGKTALALNMAQNIALEANLGVGFFSLEMSRGQLVTRMLVADAMVDADRLRKGQLSREEDWRRLDDAAHRIRQAPVWIDDTPGLTISELRSRARRLKAAHPEFQLLVVDYLQLMQGSGGPRESREQAISSISRGLKGVAKDLNVAVLALSQLNRGVESRTDKRPMLSDLRESGAIEQDADVILFIYRDDYYKGEESLHPGEAEIIIAKQRNGPTGVVRLAFVREHTRFQNLAHDMDYA